VSKKHILVTGANGQLGNEFRVLAPAYKSFTFYFTDKEELAIDDPLAIERYFAGKKIDYCINCAAYTAVDKAEEEKETAFEINATAVRSLARSCKKHNARLIHISTDYVFDGNAVVPYKESGKTDPVNLYGQSKLEGERFAMENNEQSIVIRTSWLYSSYGKNFVKTMIRLMQEKERIGVVNDQSGSPTYAADLAGAILQIIAENDSPKAGIYHYSNKGIISWYDFAVAIKELLHSNCKVEPIPAAAYPTPAQRPGYSAFDTTKIERQFGIVIPGWKESLVKCVALLEERGNFF
jgi:dTDP-4-dehydrorhamnose reductase